MATETTLMNLTKPAAGDSDWGTTMNLNLDDIDEVLAATAGMPATADEDIDPYELVYVKSTGNIALADADAAATQSMLAIAAAAVASAAEGYFRTHGYVVNGAWSWSAAKVFLFPSSTPGELTETQPNANTSPCAITLSSTEILFLPYQFAIQSARVNVGGVAGGEAKFCFFHAQPVQVLAAWIISDTATAGSGAGTKYLFEVKNKTAVTTLASEDTNVGGELLVDTPWTLGAIANGSIAGADVLKLEITKTGVPTDLSGAEVMVAIAYVTNPLA